MIVQDAHVSTEDINDDSKNIFCEGEPCGTYAVSGVDPMRNVSWILFQEGRSSELKLRQGVEQVAHTLSNPQVQCTGVFCT